MFQKKPLNGAWKGSQGWTQMPLTGLKIKSLTPSYTAQQCLWIGRKKARGWNRCQAEPFIHPTVRNVGNRATHTLSRSMSWLCLSLPSMVKKSLKCWIWSASSGFRLNSAGNSDIQYLEAGTKEQKYVLYALQVHLQRNIIISYGNIFNFKALLMPAPFIPF